MTRSPTPRKAVTAPVEHAPAPFATSLRPVGEAPLVREQALESVRSAIISGQFAPGARLTERELCDTLGVSRTVVREVIRRLEAERLVQVTAHCGPRVARLTEKAAREIYGLRAELEVLLVRDFIAHASDGHVRELEDIVGEVQAAARTADVAGLVGIMVRFYRTLTAGAGNEVAADILETLHARISRLRVLAMAQPGRIDRSVGEIQRIIAAIARRDTAAAEAATRAYIGAAREAALRQIAISEGYGQPEATTPARARRNRS